MANTNDMRDFELPNSPEAEKAVIGCILQDKKSYVEVTLLKNSCHTRTLWSLLNTYLHIKALKLWADTDTSIR